jgi:predicted phage baseplate assembly protein
MPLPVPNLDDRTFQDIVDQAKTLIPRYCPTWTDHNVSDPGVALIELFAWMTDLMLYRVNQVPDKVYVNLLEMIGVRLQPPRAAQAPITFLLSAPQPNPLVIAKGTEVATVQTETSPAIIFTTEADLMIQPAVLGAAVTWRADQEKVVGAETVKVAGIETVHDLRVLGYPKRTISVFPETPAVGDCFDLAMENDHSQQLIGLSVVSELGAGPFAQNPPWVWEVWQGTRWTPCGIDFDTTSGFNLSGLVQLSVPAMARRTLHGRSAYWLRCRVTAARPTPGGYELSPLLRRLTVESWGGTTSARHATTVRNFQLGVSDGTPGQTFRVPHTPVLDRNKDTDLLRVEPPASADATAAAPEAWTEVTDFAGSGPEDRHYTLDSIDGTITFGPALPQPDGSVYLFGAVPRRGSVIRFERYQYGGGVAGNLPRQALTVLKSSIPYVRAVENREPASGGLDAQSVEDAKLRAPAYLRARTRAVTADDYEFFARDVPGVARAFCLAPGSQPGQRYEPRPGQVVVLVIPRIDDVRGLIAIERLRLPALLQQSVQEALEPRRPLGIALDVREPQYIAVQIQATLRLTRRAVGQERETARQQAEAVLYRYLNPYTGGPDEKGWPFGRALANRELYGVLQRIEAVEYIEDLSLRIVEAAGPGSPLPTIELAPYAVLCSGRHEVVVR